MLHTNKDIAHILRSVAAVYILKDVNKFRIIAYQKAADAVEQLNREIKDIWENGQLGNVEGIGSTIAGHISEYLEKADHSYLIKTIHQLPASVFELMRVPGIGPKKAFKLVQSLELLDPDSVYINLLKAAKGGKIAALPGFGTRSENEIVLSVGAYLNRDHKEQRMPFPYAHLLSVRIITYMLKDPRVKKIEPLGSLRRRMTTVGDIDVVIVCDRKDSALIIDYFLHYPEVQKIENRGAEKTSVIMSSGCRVDLRTVAEERYGSMLQYFTGSKAHNIKLREYALKRGYSLSEYGIKKIGSKTVKPFKSEKEFYRFLNLQYIPPELREGSDEISTAKSNLLPKLVSLEDIRGDLQIHSSFDIEPSHDLGENSYEEILHKAGELHYQYVAFTDHNPSFGNHTQAQIVQIMRSRKGSLDRLSKKNKHCKFFISLEVDILPDGNLAFPEVAYPYVDMMLVSIHSSFRLSRSQMTARILKAITNPKVKILAHPTTRLLGKRGEIDIDWDAVFKECAKRRVAVEINGCPERLDLPDSLVKTAKKYQVLFSLGTDAHATPQMDNMSYAVSVARRGWLTPREVINTWSFEKIKQWVI